jgi:hypothetical protein
MAITVPRVNRSTKVILVKIGKLTLMILVLLIPIWLISKAFTTHKPVEQTSEVAGITDTGNLGAASAALPVDFQFVYPLDQKDAAGPKLTFVVTNAEKRDEILVKGKKATAVDGRTFLILNVKVINDNPQGVEINTRDFFRLSTNGNTAEWLAPDIHNDPVEVQAISTKYTRLGFPINDADTNLILQVGQIDAEKQQLPLNF